MGNQNDDLNLNAHYIDLEMILIEQLVLSWHQRVLNPVQEMTIKMLIKVKRVNHSNLWTF